MGSIVVYSPSYDYRRGLESCQERPLLLVYFPCHQNGNTLLQMAADASKRCFADSSLFKVPHGGVYRVINSFLFETNDGGWYLNLKNNRF